ncbi:TetR/AcrR family transcriptional regulator [Yinghuangia soli]|uniref:TetR/AcrR family transcriptional regulator n=1 Tax=Yinghuangia soli TaxID=2908204 RepID=A0AA41PXH5_9ACTN|nr:TetR/AcrR family transcriptional regulator [Yinghuangia soli]MCF2527016.1 TetR/AcrR family transcriptional regulator [Yinghuangia soli]
MPRITAATVADHRANQRSALLQAARDLLLTDGAGAVTFTAVAERAGLARNSVYKYFADRRDLLTALVADATPRWTGPIRVAMEAADTPADRIAAFVTAQLELVRSGEHRVAQALADGPDAAALRAGADRAHADILVPLVEALEALHDPDPRRTAVLLQGFVNAATKAVESGDDFEAVSRRAVQLAVAAVTSAPGEADR